MNPSLSVSVSNVRSGRSFAESDVPVLFYNGILEITISKDSETEMDRRNLTIRAFASETSSFSSEELIQTSSELKQRYGYHYDFSKGKQKGKADLVFREEQGAEQNFGKQNVVSDYKEDFFCRYLPSQYSLLPTLVDEYSELLKAKKDKELLRAMQTIEPNLVDIVVVGNELMVDVGGDIRLPLFVLGDGVRKYLRIIIGIHAAKNGAYLIDEIENGLHFTALKELWRIILKESALYNVQVFVTTHDKDVIAALTECASEGSNEEVSVSAYKIIKQDDGNVSVLRYDRAQLIYMMTQNIEISDGSYIFRNPKEGNLRVSIYENIYF